MQWVKLVWKAIEFVFELFGIGQKKKLDAVIKAAHEVAEKAARNEVAEEEAHKAASYLNDQLKKSYSKLSKLPNNSERKKALEKKIYEGDKVLSDLLNTLERM